MCNELQGTCLSCTGCHRPAKCAHMIWQSWVYITHRLTVASMSRIAGEQPPVTVQHHRTIPHQAAVSMLSDACCYGKQIDQICIWNQYDCLICEEWNVTHRPRVSNMPYAILLVRAGSPASSTTPSPPRASPILVSFCSSSAWMSCAKASLESSGNCFDCP